MDCDDPDAVDVVVAADAVCVVVAAEDVKGFNGGVAFAVACVVKDYGAVVAVFAVVAKDGVGDYDDALVCLPSKEPNYG